MIKNQTCCLKLLLSHEAGEALYFCIAAVILVAKGAPSTGTVKLGITTEHFLGYIQLCNHTLAYFRLFDMSKGEVSVWKELRILYTISLLFLVHV